MQIHAVLRGWFFAVTTSIIHPTSEAEGYLPVTELVCVMQLSDHPQNWRCPSGSTHLLGPPQIILFLGEAGVRCP